MKCGANKFGAGGGRGDGGGVCRMNEQLGWKLKLMSMDCRSSVRTHPHADTWHARPFDRPPPRAGAFSEAELRLQFLQCRDEWIGGLLADLDDSDSYEFVKHLTDVHRLHLFDAVMQYRAIFFDTAPSGAAGGVVRGGVGGGRAGGGGQVGGRARRRVGQHTVHAEGRIAGRSAG